MSFSSDVSPIIAPFCAVSSFSTVVIRYSFIYAFTSVRGWSLELPVTTKVSYFSNNFLLQRFFIEFLCYLDLISPFSCLLFVVIKMVPGKNYSCNLYILYISTSSLSSLFLLVLHILFYLCLTLFSYPYVTAIAFNFFRKITESIHYLLQVLSHFVDLIIIKIFFHEHRVSVGYPGLQVS